ncbi:hypothetical protein D3C87_1832070 [compost metagenome]
MRALLELAGFTKTVKVWLIGCGPLSRRWIRTSYLSTSSLKACTWRPFEGALLARSRTSRPPSASLKSMTCVSWPRLWKVSGSEAGVWTGIWAHAVRLKVPAVNPRSSVLMFIHFSLTGMYRLRGTEM